MGNHLNHNKTPKMIPSNSFIFITKNLCHIQTIYRFVTNPIAYSDYALVSIGIFGMMIGRDDFDIEY